MSPSEPSGPHQPTSKDEVWRDGPIYSLSERPVARMVARPIREFLRIEAAGGVLLVIAAVIALLWANLARESYDSFWHTHASLHIGSFHMEESLQHWVNDALMVIFFFVVGLEIKHELVHGDLRDPRTAAMPVIAALGGMAAPALLYVALAGGGEAGRGWGIPMATDIAFAVGVVGLLGRRIPSAARIFLLTLAIADDIGAILVIALFYTSDLALNWLAAALACCVAIAMLRKMRVWSVPVYLALGLTCWFATFQSGVHATLAGVAVALLTPARPLLEADVARDYARTALADHDLNPHELTKMRFLLNESVSVVERLQSALHPFSSYVVLPIFALANAGVYLGGGVLGEALTSKVALGIMVGLFVGKPLGIVLFCFIADRLKIATLPDRTTWPMMVGLGLVAGIGFTVSLFIAGLAFDHAELVADSKVGILIGSLTSAIAGVLVLRMATAGRVPHPDDDLDPDAIDEHAAS